MIGNVLLASSLRPVLNDGLGSSLYHSQHVKEWPVVTSVEEFSSLMILQSEERSHYVAMENSSEAKAYALLAVEQGVRLEKKFC